MKIGNYNIIKEIARRDLNVCYQAYHETSNLKVFLKFVPKIAGEDEILGLKQEFNILFEHPHSLFPELIDWVESDDSVALVQSWIEGNSLKEQVPVKDINVFYQILFQILQVLAFCHRNEIIHGDIKSDNFRISWDRFSGLPLITLVDFGFASQGNKEIYAGSPQYMAPELFKKSPVSYRADNYSLGILIHEMVFGDVPLKSNNLEDYSNFHTNIDRYVLNLNKKLLRNFVSAEDQTSSGEIETLTFCNNIYLILGKLLTKSPETRCSDTNELLRLLLKKKELAGVFKYPVMNKIAFIDREPEFEILRKSTIDLCHGTGNLIKLRGISGSGKTLLLKRYCIFLRKELIHCFYLQSSEELRVFVLVYNFMMWIKKQEDLKSIFTGDSKAIIDNLLNEMTQDRQGEIQGKVQLKEFDGITSKADKENNDKTVEIFFKILETFLMEFPLVFILDLNHEPSGQLKELTFKIEDLTHEERLLFILSHTTKHEFQDDRDFAQLFLAKPGLQEIVKKKNPLKLNIEPFTKSDSTLFIRQRLDGFEFTNTLETSLWYASTGIPALLDQNLQNIYNLKMLEWTDGRYNFKGDFLEISEFNISYLRNLRSIISQHAYDLLVIIAIGQGYLNLQELSEISGKSGEYIIAFLSIFKNTDIIDENFWVEFNNPSVRSIYLSRGLVRSAGKIKRFEIYKIILSVLAPRIRNYISAVENNYARLNTGVTNLIDFQYLGKLLCYYSLLVARCGNLSAYQHYRMYSSYLFFQSKHYEEFLKSAVILLKNRFAYFRKGILWKIALVNYFKGDYAKISKNISEIYEVERIETKIKKRSYEKKNHEEIKYKESLVLSRFFENPEAIQLIIFKITSLLKTGELRTGMALIQKTKKRKRRKISRYEELILNLLESYVYYLKCQYDKTLEILSSISSEDLEILNIKDEITWIGYYYHLRSIVKVKKGKLEEASSILREALELARKRKDKSWISTIHFNLAGIELYKNNIENAIQKYLICEKIKKELGDLKGLALIYQNISSAYLRKGELEKALSHGKNSLELYLRLEQWIKVVSLTLIIANIEMALGHYDKASMLVRDAQDTSRELELKDYLIQSFYIEAQLNLEKGEIEKSIKLYNECLRLSIKFALLQNVARCENSLAFIHCYIKNFKQAREYILKAWLKAKQTGFQSLKPHILLNMCQINLDLKRTDFVEKLLKLIEKSGYLHGLQEQYNEYLLIKGNLFLIKNDAASCSVILSKLKDSIEKIPMYYPGNRFLLGRFLLLEIQFLKSTGHYRNAKLLAQKYSCEKKEILPAEFLHDLEIEGKSQN